MDSVAVVGLGGLGSALARRVGAVAALTAVDTDADRRAACARWHDGPVLGSIEDVPWDGIDRAAVVVRTTDQALAVVDAIARAVRRPLPVHLHTTLDPHVASGLGELTDRVRLLEQPVTGGVEAAARGELTVLTAGPAMPADVAWTARLATTVLPFADYGQPTLAKLLNNVVAAANLDAATRLIELGAALGLPPEQIRTVLDHGSGGSWMSRALPGLVEDGVRLLAKDVDLLERIAGDLPAIDLHDADGVVRRLDAIRSRSGTAEPSSAIRPPEDARHAYAGEGETP